MAGNKRPASSVAEGSKKKRKAISLETKMKIIVKYEGGQTLSSLAKEFDMACSTIATIVKDKERIREASKNAASTSATVIVKNRAGPMEDMEKMLLVWLEDQTQKRIPISMFMIQAKARSLFEMLKVKLNDPTYDTSFSASSGWFDRFKKRHNFHNVKVSGEAASADTEGAEKYKVELHKMIVSDGYLPEQIFNVDETAMYFKEMPERSYVHQQYKVLPGFKRYKNRATLLLGGNVAGHKLKPLFIWMSQNPRAFAGLSKHLLPVYYRSNTKAWMTRAMFEDWYVNCFIPEVKDYCAAKNVPFKILLLLDNAPGHPDYLTDLNPDVKVVFLPKNTTSILQPMDQGAIATFKAYYLRRNFADAVRVMDEKCLTLVEYWKKFNILDAIKNVAAAWDEVTEECMNGIWKKLLDIYVNNFKGFDKKTEVNNIVQNKIMLLSQQLKLQVDDDDIHKMLENVPSELTNEELEEIETERKESEAKHDHNDDVDEAPTKKFSTKELASVFRNINAEMKRLEAMDINYERYSRVERGVLNSLSCYQEIYNDRKRQTIQSSLDRFVFKVPSSVSSSVSSNDPQDDPQPSTSGLQQPPVYYDGLTDEEDDDLY